MTTRQWRFVIKWKAKNGVRTIGTDSKLVASAHLSAILTSELAAGRVMHVGESSAMEQEVRPDGTTDSWNRVRVRRYFLTPPGEIIEES